MFRTFLATLKQIMQSYSGCITDCQQDFEKEKHLENTFQNKYSVYDYVINDSLFLR